METTAAGSHPIQHGSLAVGDIVGSGTPWIDEAGNLRVRGKYASIELGQHIRSLVNEGHPTAVSVEFLAAALLARSPDDDGPLQLTICRRLEWPGVTAVDQLVYGILCRASGAGTLTGYA